MNKTHTITLGVLLLGLTGGGTPQLQAGGVPPKVVAIALYTVTAAAIGGACYAFLSNWWRPMAPQQALTQLQKKHTALEETHKKLTQNYAELKDSHTRLERTVGTLTTLTDGLTREGLASIAKDFKDLSVLSIERNKQLDRQDEIINTHTNLHVKLGENIIEIKQLVHEDGEARATMLRRMVDLEKRVKGLEEKQVFSNLNSRIIDNVKRNLNAEQPPKQ